MEITKLSSKGQIVIPQRMRNELKIDEGSTIALEIMDNILILKKIDIDLIKQFKNSLADIKAGKIKRVA